MYTVNTLKPRVQLRGISRETSAYYFGPAGMVAGIVAANMLKMKRPGLVAMAFGGLAAGFMAGYVASLPPAESKTWVAVPEPKPAPQYSVTMGPAVIGESAS